MEKEFVPYNIALELRDLGFDEPCFGFYNEICEDNDKEGTSGSFQNMCGWVLGRENTDDLSSHDFIVIAPLYQQAFRWFRENHNLHTSIDAGILGYYGYFKIKPIGTLSSRVEQGWINTEETPFKTHEEAELACLKRLIEIKKLIEIIRNKQ
jgi:hypothetical protein